MRPLVAYSASGQRISLLNPQDDAEPGPSSSSISPAELARHQCPTCGRRFTTSGHLTRHCKVHTGEKNYSCPFPDCAKRCSRQDNLVQHFRIHLPHPDRSRGSAYVRGVLDDMRAASRPDPLVNAEPPDEFRSHANVLDNTFSLSSEGEVDPSEFAFQPNSLPASSSIYPGARDVSQRPPLRAPSRQGQTGKGREAIASSPVTMHSPTVTDSSPSSALPFRFPRSTSSSSSAYAESSSYHYASMASPHWQDHSRTGSQSSSEDRGRGFEVSSIRGTLPQAHVTPAGKPRDVSIPFDSGEG